MWKPSSRYAEDVFHMSKKTSEINFGIDLSNYITSITSVTKGFNLATLIVQLIIQLTDFPPG